MAGMYLPAPPAVVKIAVMEEQPLASVLLVFLTELLWRRLGEGAIVGHGKALLEALTRKSSLDDRAWKLVNTEVSCTAISKIIGKCGGPGYSTRSLNL